MKHKELAESRKYSLPRLEYTSYQENQNFTLVIPQEGKLHSRIMQKSRDIFSKDINEVEQFKSWGHIYLSLRPADAFIPENIIDTWDETVRKYGDDAAKELARIVAILTDEYLLE
jgi:dTDP-D-glucose 4,6-dehydratase